MRSEVQKKKVKSKIHEKVSTQSRGRKPVSIKLSKVSEVLFRSERREIRFDGTK